MMQRCVLALALAAGHAFVTTTHRPCSALHAEFTKTGERKTKEAPLSDDVFPSSACDIFIGNMPYGMTDEYVEELVYTVRKTDGSPVNPDLLRVTVPKQEENTNKDKGFAFVKVLDATQASDLANALDGFEYYGRILNANVKESKKKWVEKEKVDPGTLDDGGLLAELDRLEDRFVIQEYGLDFIRNACKKAGIKAGGDLEQCTARLLKIQGLEPAVYLNPEFGLIPVRNGRRNAGGGRERGKSFNSGRKPGTRWSK
jgi:hypothetical protein